MLIDILTDKRNQLISCDGKRDADFIKSDIDVLTDVNELRMFKMSVVFPKDFIFSKSKEESIQKILGLDKDSPESYYRVLEYCVISQPVLQESVNKVFKNWRFFNGLRATWQRGAGSSKYAKFRGD